MQYGHDAAVADGVNMDFDVYRINTRVTEEGATIAADPGAVYVAQRDKLTRRERLERLTDDLTYTANQVDRDVVAVSQIRTVLREFRDAVLPAAFPDRDEVPKTLVFAKDDSHAEDIVRLAREEFGEGNEFCQKITYRTGFTKVPTTVKGEDGAERESFEWRKTADMTPEELLASFRNSYHPRIAVTVDTATSAKGAGLPAGCAARDGGFVADRAHSPALPDCRGRRCRSPKSQGRGASAPPACRGQEVSKGTSSVRWPKAIAS